MPTLNSKIAEVAFKVSGHLEDEELQEILGQRGTDVTLSSIDVSRDQKINLLKRMLYDSSHATQWGFRLSTVGDLPEVPTTAGRSWLYGQMDEATRRLHNYINHLNENNADNNNNPEVLDVSLTSSNEFSLRGFPKYDEVFGKPIKGDTILNAHIRRVMHNFFKISENTAVPQGVAKNLYLHLINQDMSLSCQSAANLSTYNKQNIYYDMDSESRDKINCEDPDDFVKYWNKAMTNISWNVRFREGTYSHELANKRGEQDNGRFVLPRSMDGWHLMNMLTTNREDKTVFSLEPYQTKIEATYHSSVDVHDLI